MKPGRCARCGAAAVVPVVPGLSPPSPEGEAALRRGEIAWAEPAPGGHWRLQIWPPETVLRTGRGREGCQLLER